jgi:hypothetical protein
LLRDVLHLESGPTNVSRVKVERNCADDLDRRS